MIHTETVEIRTPGAGSLSITEPVAAAVGRSGIRTGLCSVFCLHTSASILITENRTSRSGSPASPPRGTGATGTRRRGPTTWPRTCARR
jgi:hypothetical protein